MNVENDTLNFFPIIHSDNAYPRVYNNCGENSGTFLTEYGCAFGSGIPERAVFRSNNIPTIINSVLLSLHIGGAKYKIIFPFTK